MCDKSYVTLETRICPVCCAEHETNSLLLHRRLQKVFDRRTPTGWDFCPKHTRLKNEGYVAVVGVDPAKCNGMTPDGVWRTGKVAHVRSTAWPKIFGDPVPAGMLCFANDDVFDILDKMAHPDDREDTSEK